MGRGKTVRLAGLLHRAVFRCGDKAAGAPQRAVVLSDLPSSSLGETRFLSTFVARHAAVPSAYIDFVS